MSADSKTRQHVKRERVHCRLRDHVEPHRIHWVCNLNDIEHAALFKEAVNRCPKKIEGVTMSRKQARKLALYGDILIPILERDGAVPQDKHFQDMMKVLGLNTYKVSEILEKHYEVVRKYLDAATQSSASASA